MATKISSYSISLLLILLLTSTSLSAQGKGKSTIAVEEVPLLNGIYIGADLYGVAAKGLGSDFISSEVSVEVDLKNRFFPVAEIGYGSTDTWSEKGIHYKGSSPYFRFGLNYNTMHKKENKLGYLYVGLRYGISQVKYDVYSLPAEDPIWGGGAPNNPNIVDGIWGGSIPFNHQGLKSTVHWTELVVGVRVNVYKRLSMGWALRMKYRKSTSLSDYGDPWYVPGFGEYDSSNMGLTYTVSYKLPVKK